MVILTSFWELNMNNGGSDNLTGVQGVQFQKDLHTFVDFISRFSQWKTKKDSLVAHTPSGKCSLCKIHSELFLPQSLTLQLQDFARTVSLLGEGNILPVQTPWLSCPTQQDRLDNYYQGFKKKTLETLQPRSMGNEQTKTCNTTDTFVKVIHQGPATLKKLRFNEGLQNATDLHNSLPHQQLIE